MPFTYTPRAENSLISINNLPWAPDPNYHHTAPRHLKHYFQKPRNLQFLSAGSSHII